MPHKNDPVLKIDDLRERKLISAINYLLGRRKGFIEQMPDWVKNTLTDYQDSYHSKLKKLQEEN